MSLTNGQAIRLLVEQLTKSRIAQLDQRTARSGQMSARGGSGRVAPKEEVRVGPRLCELNARSRRESLFILPNSPRPPPRVSYFAFIKFSNMSNTDQQLRNQGKHTDPITE